MITNVACVVVEILSDNSIAYSIEYEQPDATRGVMTFTFACEDQEHANELAKALDRCAWLDFSQTSGK